MAEKFSKKAFSGNPQGRIKGKNRSGGDGPRKEALKRDAKRQTNKTHGVERRPGGS